MVPFSSAKRAFFKIKEAMIQFQYKPFSFSKRLWLFCMLGIKPEDMRPSTKCWEIHRRRRKALRAGLHVVLTLEALGCVALFVTQGLRPRKANASAKHVKDCMYFSRSRRNLVACSKWAHFHFSSGYAFVKLRSAR